MVVVRADLFVVCVCAVCNKSQPPGAAGLSDSREAPTNMYLVLFRLSCGFAVDWVVEVHAFGAVPPPVAVNKINAGTQHPEDHCGNNRNCMCLTYSVRGHVNTRLTGGGMTDKTARLDDVLFM